MTIRERYEAMKQNLKENQVVKEAKTHLEKHKHAYGYGGMGVALLAVGFFAIRKPNQPMLIVNNVTPVFNINKGE
jgi:hypothetical protein